MVDLVGDHQGAGRAGARERLGRARHAGVRDRDALEVAGRAQVRRVGCQVDAEPARGLRPLTGQRARRADDRDPRDDALAQQSPRQLDRRPGLAGPGRRVEEEAPRVPGAMRSRARTCHPRRELNGGRRGGAGGPCGAAECARRSGRIAKALQRRTAPAARGVRMGGGRGVQCPHARRPRPAACRIARGRMFDAQPSGRYAIASISTSIRGSMSARDLHHRGDGRRGAEAGRVGAADLLPAGDVGDEQPRLHHVLGPRPGEGERGEDVAARLLGLVVRARAAHDPAVGVDRRAPGHQDERPGAHRARVPDQLLVAPTRGEPLDHR